MLHFDGQFLSIKKAMFAVKRGEYFRKYNIFEVNFDSGVCISMACIHKKRIHDFPPKFYSSNLNFWAKITENGTQWPLYREICHQQVLDYVDRPEGDNSGTPKIFQYWPILECSSIWYLKYTFSQQLLSMALFHWKWKTYPWNTGCQILDAYV